MNRESMKSYEMLTRMVGFATTNVGLFPKNSAAAEILKALESGVSELSAKAAAKVSAEIAMRTAANERKASREKLQGYIAWASRIARELNTDKVRMPANGTDQALIDSGHAFVADVESMAKDFAKHGVGPEEVGAAVEALENAIRGYSKARAERSASVEETDKVLEDTLSVLRRFDALVERYLEDNAGAMASYAIARAVSRKKAHRTVTKESEAAPAVPVPSTTPDPDAHAHAAAA